MFVTVDKKGEAIRRSKKDFNDVYQNLIYLKYDIVINKMISLSFVDDWLIDPAMRTYDKLDLLPMRETPVDIYNTFCGF